MKTAGLVALVLAFTMVVVGSAQATTATDSAGGSPVEVNDTIHATNVGNTVLDGTINISCKKSTFSGRVTDAGSSSTTIKWSVETLTFEECGNSTISVINGGTLEAHTDSSEPDGNGVLTSSNAEVTLLTHNILGTVHCIYKTNATAITTLDGSNNTGGTATLTTDSVALPQNATDFYCGSTAEWTAEYTVTTPDYLYIDGSKGEPKETPVTSPAGTKVKEETKVKGEAEGEIQMDAEGFFTCKKSSFEGEVKSTGSETSVSIPLSKLTLEECGTATVTVSKAGTLEVDATSGGNGTVTSSGAEVTVLTHNILGTIHCIYKTEKSDLGTFKGSKTTGATATWEVGESTLVVGSTDTGCGKSAILTGNYKLTSPDYLDMDGKEAKLTSPAGAKVENGTKIKAEAEKSFQLDGAAFFTCQKTSLEGEVNNTGSETSVSVPLSKLTFEECGNATVTVIKAGTVEIDATSGGNGTLTSSGAEFTLLTHNVLGTVHCIYYTENSDLGSFKGSKTTGATATWEIGESPILRKATDAGCGNTSVLTGNYKFTSPDYLDVD